MTTPTLDRAKINVAEWGQNADCVDGNSRLAVMFTDMEGSTRMIEELGEATALTMLIEHHRIVRNQVAAHAGREVKNLGDGFLLEFPSARDAIDCATAIQQALDDYNRTGPPRPVRVRCGITVGAPLRHGLDLFGRCVVLASRIVGEAHGGEILVSGELKDEVGPSAGVTFGRGWKIQAKGLRGAQSVFEVNWKPAQEDDGAPARVGMRQAASSARRATEAIAMLLPLRLGVSSLEVAGNPLTKG